MQKDLYFVKKRFSQEQEKFIYFQNLVHDFQDKNLMINKRIFYPKYKYYYAVSNERPLKNYYPYIYRKERGSL